MLTAVVGPFEFGLAGHDPELDACQRLRYRVYVEEYGWESAADHPDGRERDAFDPASLHIFMRIPGCHEVAATCRLILPNPSSVCPTPVFAALPVDRDEDHPLHPTRLAPDTWLEASRLTVAPKYRRTSPAVAGMAAVQVSFFASAGLCLSVMAVCNALHRPHCVSAHELRTGRLIRRFGIDQTQIGAPFEYHGPRALFVSHADRIRQTVLPELAEVYDQLEAWARVAVAEPMPLLRQK
jgi:N-acyl amino acid synthase of PEP-CTERM/exosortase system